MDFAQKLQDILSHKHVGKGQNVLSMNELVSWNEEVEALLFASPQEQRQMLDEKKEEYIEPLTKAELDAIARALKESLVLSLSNALGMSSTTEEIEIQERMKYCMDKIQDCNTTDKIIIQDRINNAHWNQLEHLCRTSSNFFRWYLQVYLQEQSLVYPMCSSPFQASTILSILVFLIEYNAKQSGTTESQVDLSPSQRLARYASLLLFYTTFSPRSPNDEAMQRTHERLVSDIQIIPRIFKILTYESSTSAALALSLIRNVHNLLANYAGAVEALKQTGVPYNNASDQPARAPWNPQVDDNTDGLITYPSIFRDILIWSLNGPGLPPFPGPKEDKRSELVVEILGILFAMGGTEISRALRYPCPNPALSQLVVTVLKDMDSKKDARIAQVQLSTVTILTDASPSFGTYLVEQQALQSLLEIAENQIDSVLEQTQVDDIAVSALVPSLGTLYKLSAGNPTFREAAKAKIFPKINEDRFWTLAQEQLDNSAGATTAAAQQTRSNGNDAVLNRVPPAKNMHPLDAPQGTLRYKLIRLMTWTEGHIKRYASELLYALCDEDPKEFVLRTGLGNAIAFLGAKGMVQLPAHALK